MDKVGDQRQLAPSFSVRKLAPSRDQDGFQLLVLSLHLLPRRHLLRGTKFRSQAEMGRKQYRSRQQRIHYQGAAQVVDHLLELDLQH